MRRNILLFLSIFSLTLLSCREEHRYDFKAIERNLLGGKFITIIGGGYGKNYEDKWKKKIDFGGPYYIAFDFAVKPNDSLRKLTIKDIQLVGQNTGTKYSLADIHGDKVRVYEEEKFIRISAGPLGLKGSEYQNYSLTATVVIHKNDTDWEEQTISILLETKYSLEWRSDWFDKLMSV